VPTLFRNVDVVRVFFDIYILCATFEGNLVCFFLIGLCCASFPTYVFPDAVRSLSGVSLSSCDARDETVELRIVEYHTLVQYANHITFIYCPIVTKRSTFKFVM